MDLGRIGVWAGEFAVPGAARIEAAAELEALGFGALWFPNGPDSDTFGAFDAMLSGSSRIRIASGILNIWGPTPADVGAWWRRLSSSHQERVMIGLGVSHALAIGERYSRPLETMARYLDGLDAAGVPAEHRCLAALGPKMLDLSAARTAGAHPYLVTVEHTAQARSRLGPGVLLAPELGVVLESDPAKARNIAREGLAMYQRLENYRNSWLRLGFSEDEINAGSDRLIDALFAHGDPAAIAQRVRAHFDAGADHVAVQLVRGAAGARSDIPMSQYRELAKALL
jgi:probable F420-dependent oxidoreductase